MKKADFSKLKFNMLLYFLLFTVLIIGLLWVFQLFFLEGYYQTASNDAIRNHGAKLSKSYGTELFEKNVENCANFGYIAYVAPSDFDEGKAIVFPTDTPMNFKNREVVQSAVDSIIETESEYIVNTYNFNGDDYTEAAVLYYVTAVESDGVINFLVLIYPYYKLTEVVGLLNVQFVIVSVIVAILGLILSLFLADRLSKPINTMSETAKRWAAGDNSVTFTASGYSEIHELAEALNYAKDGVNKSRELQRDLLANVSHDLKTPLTMIKAYAEMIKDISGDNKEKREKHTKVIIDEADRLTMLVNDILNLSKLQSSVEDLDVKEIDLSELTERVISRFSAFMESQGYTIEEHIAPDLLTAVDEKKIEQVIYNLLGNSLNYTGDDKTVKVYLSAENDKILLEIIDSGKGISQEKIDSIWERYYRFSETNTRPVKGTGLGLSIVKAILDNHHLRYGVRSKKDCGSNFYVEFNRLKNE
ncbi:MAG: HAMP domain-containing histidine kinase [Clostridia bacterium]|nr:HAMP domain-containing histidine kinase [Clostridia bacterium]